MTNVGVVTEVGKDVTDFKVGDRVTIRAYMAGCDTKGIHERCHYCEEGRLQLLSQLRRALALRRSDHRRGLERQLHLPRPRPLPISTMN